MVIQCLQDDREHKAQLEVLRSEGEQAGEGGAGGGEEGGGHLRCGTAIRLVPVASPTNVTNYLVT